MEASSPDLCRGSSEWNNCRLNLPYCLSKRRTARLIWPRLACTCFDTIATSLAVYTFRAHMIECAIEEWLRGSREDITFSADSYKSKYEHHLHSIHDYDSRSGDRKIMTNICRRLAEEGRANAKAEEAPESRPRTLAPNAIDKAIADYARKNGNLSESEEEDDDAFFGTDKDTDKEGEE